MTAGSFLLAGGIVMRIQKYLFGLLLGLALATAWSASAQALPPIREFYFDTDAAAAQHASQTAATLSPSVFHVAGLAITFPFHCDVPLQSGQCLLACSPSRSQTQLCSGCRLIMRQSPLRRTVLSVGKMPNFLYRVTDSRQPPFHGPAIVPEHHAQQHRTRTSLPCPRR